MRLETLPSRTVRRVGPPLERSKDGLSQKLVVNSSFNPGAFFIATSRLYCLVYGSLHEQQISKDVSAVPQACCQLVMCSSFNQEAMCAATSRLHYIGYGLLHPFACTADLHRCDCSATSLLSACHVQQLQTGGNAVCHRQCSGLLLLGPCPLYMYSRSP